VSLRDELNHRAPRLRRYARALVAAHPDPSEIADDIVQAALRRALETATPDRGFDLDDHLYCLITELHHEALRAASLGSSAAFGKGGLYIGGVRQAEKMASLCPPRDQLSGALGGLKLEEREALLLVVLEGLSYARAARILKISRPILIARLSRARHRLNETLSLIVHKAKPRPAYLRLVK